MTREKSILLIAAAGLFGMATLSIVGAGDGRIAFDNQPDAMVTQLYTPKLYASNVAAHDRQDAVLGSGVARPSQQVPH